jgi:hypothetical protein
VPNVAFFRSQADAYCKLAEVIETGEAVTASSLILAEELRGLAREYYAQAEQRLIVDVRPEEARSPPKEKGASPEAGALPRSSRDTSSS